VSAAEIARALGDAQRDGRGWRCCCPLHGGRSLVLRDGDQGRVLATCWAGCNRLDVIAELRRRGLLDDRADRIRNGRVKAICQIDHLTKRNGRLALEIWNAGRDVGGTLAARYLASRKLVLPEGVSGRAIRFHPACPFGGDRHPTMIGLFRAIVNNQPRAIHRTALTLDGDKLGRKVLGPKSGTAIKLTADEDVTTGIAIGEGIESTLAGMLLGFVPAWALGDVSGIASFPVLPGLETLTIFVDHDVSGTGQRRAIECSRRWTTAGRQVFRVVPIKEGADLADIIVGRAA
jgi:putative DNA primase/helicase